MKKYTLSSLSVSIILFFALPFVTFSQDGSLDYTFGINGIVTTVVGDISGASDIAIQTDGKIVVAGNSSIVDQTFFTLTRYNTNGSLDSTFGTTGIVITCFQGFCQANAMAIQADGKIVVAGFSGWPRTLTLTRYNSNGSLDNTFSGNGIETPFSSPSSPNEDPSSANAISIQADGKIVVAGASGFITRLNTNGSLDTTFGGGLGSVLTSIFNNTENDITTANAIDIQADGKIVVAGSGYSSIVDQTFFALTRHNTNGSIDSTFDTDGIVTTSIETSSGASAISIQIDGKIVVTGYSENYLGNMVFALSRYNTNGSLDTNFGTAGIVTTNLLNGIAIDISIQTDGKIVVAGYSSYNGPQSLFSITRYNTNGSLDNTFGNVGIVTTSIGVNSLARGIALQADGKIVVAGGSDNTFTVVRYNNSLTGDISENSNNTSQISIYPNPFSKATTLKTDNLFENATFIVYNTLGEQVRKIDNISGQTFTFYRENLDEGIYFYHLKENNKMLSVDKLIICD